MSQQPMCQTCRSMVVDAWGNKCPNCWEVERRLPGYLQSARGLRVVMAMIQEELRNEAHLRGIL